MRPVSRPFALAAFAALVCGTMLASADAPPGQYALFSPQSQAIYDSQTKLRWQRFITDSPKLQSDAAGLCASTPSLPTARLPTYRELLTLVDEDGHAEWDPSADGGASTLRYIDRNAFPATPAAAFWTMSPGASGGFKVVDFGTGETRDLVGPGANAYYRCVSDK